MGMLGKASGLISFCILVNCGNVFHLRKQIHSRAFAARRLSLFPRCARDSTRFPPSSAKKAVIKWFDPSRNFGFVLLSNSDSPPEVFFHKDRCQGVSGSNTLSRGVPVRVEMEWDPKRNITSVSNLWVVDNDETDIIDRASEISRMSTISLQLDLLHPTLSQPSQEGVWYDPVLIRGPIWRAIAILLKTIRSPQGSGPILPHIVTILGELNDKNWTFSPKQRRALRQGYQLAVDMLRGRDDMDIPKLDHGMNPRFDKEKARNVLRMRTKRLVVVLEGITDISNRYGIFRTCDALGIHEVWIVKSQEKKLKLTPEDPHTLSKNTERGLKVINFETADDLIRYARTTNYTIWVTSLRQGAVPLGHNMDGIREEDKIALVMGSESAGISDLMHEAADKAIYLPTYGFVESLNVNVATALVLGRLLDIFPSLRVGICEDEINQILNEWKDDGTVS
ncbi:hypothetical protein AAMO2058_001607300 [Amorphochlora amoebiformis]